MPWILATTLIAIFFLVFPSAPSSFSFSDLAMAAPISGSVDTVRVPEKNIPYSSKPQRLSVAAPSYAAYDASSRFSLTSQRAHEARPIASITKLMTALVFLDHNPGWGKKVTITRADYREGGRINLFPGDSVTAGDLFRVGLVASDNVAIAALVRSTGLSEKDFVAAMNEKALRLRLTHSAFADPTGLDARNVSTAHDIARLAAAAFKEPAIRETVTRSSYTFTTEQGNTKTIVSTDKLLEADLDDGIALVAGKTGHLNEAGYCFVGQFEKDGHDIITVVLGADTESARFEETKKLAEWAFNEYDWNH